MKRYTDKLNSRGDKMSVEMTDDQKRLFKAIGHMSRNGAEIPKNLSILMSELKEYEAAAVKIQDAMTKAEESLNELTGAAEQTMTSIDTIVKMVSKVAPDDLIKKYSEEYDLRAEKKE